MDYSNPDILCRRKKASSSALFNITPYRRTDFTMVSSRFLMLALSASASVVAAATTPARSVIASAQCTKALPKGRAPGNEYTIPYTDKEGRSRDYLLFLPPKYSTTSNNPIIFSYHGGTRTPESQRDLDRLETPYFNTDHIVVYLRGYEVSNICQRSSPMRLTRDSSCRNDGKALPISPRETTLSTPATSWTTSRKRTASIRTAFS